MRMEVVNPAGYTENVQDVIRGTGAWYVVHQLQSGAGDEQPVYHAGAVRDVDEAERVAAGFADLFPERNAAAVGFPRGWQDEPPLVYVYRPDDADGRELPQEDRSQIILGAVLAHQRAVAVATRARNAVAGRGQPGQAAGQAAGPDLTDHLYQNKQAFPQQQRDDGRPAGELASSDPDADHVADYMDRERASSAEGGEGGGQ